MYYLGFLRGQQSNRRFDFGNFFPVILFTRIYISSLRRLQWVGRTRRSWRSPSLANNETTKPSVGVLRSFNISFFYCLQKKVPFNYDSFSLYQLNVQNPTLTPFKYMNNKFHRCHSQQKQIYSFDVYHCPTIVFLTQHLSKRFNNKDHKTIIELPP